MLFHSRTLSSLDTERLAKAIGSACRSPMDYAPHLDFFGRELRRATVVPPREIPGDMITMNSRFVVTDSTTGETRACVLTYPEQNDAPDTPINVLSPMGMALLGTRVGEEICWLSSAGPRVAKVMEILHQPEKAGHQ